MGYVRKVFQLPRDPGPAIWLTLLLALAATSGIYCSWLQQHIGNPDMGIVSLMARHMAKGDDFPIFFYGQAYMGSLEPAISSMFCKWLGFSNFAVCLGTAFVSFLMMPVIYRWGREAGKSHVAGLVALGFCVIGPEPFFHYTGAPRGGYALTLLFTVMILTGTADLLARRIGDSLPSVWRFFLLGLIAGLAWWTNQLILPALGTAALVIMCEERLRLLAPAYLGRMVVATLAFTLGSLPFWWWNATHEWGSFAFVNSIRWDLVPSNLVTLGRERLPKLLSLTKFPLPLAWAVAVAYLAAFGVALSLVIRLLKKGEERRQRFMLMVAVLYPMVLVAVYVISHFATMNTSRYLLPLVPCLAVYVGVTMAGLWQHGWRSIVVILMTALIVWQGGSVHRGWADRKRVSEDLYGKLGPWAEAVDRDIHVPIVTDFLHHFWNAEADEKLCMFEATGERVPAYARLAETSAAVAVHCAYRGLETLLESLRIRADFDGRRDLFLWAGFKQESRRHAPVPVAVVESIVDSDGVVLGGLLADGCLDTGWFQKPDLDRSVGILTFRFTRPVALSKIVIRSRDSEPAALPLFWSAEGEDADDKTVPLVGRTAVQGLFWSGERFYGRGAAYRVEALPDQMPVTKLNLRMEWSPGRPPRIGAIHLFEGAVVTNAPPSLSTTELATLLKERGVQRLYCDRWEANRLRELLPSVYLPFERAIYRLPEPDLRPSDEFILSPETAILLASEHTEMARSVFALAHIPVTTERLGQYVLMRLAADAWKEGFAADHGIRWAGYSPVIGSRKRLAWQLIQRAKQESDSAQELLEQARGLYGNWTTETSEAISNFKAPVKISGGIELLGLTCEPAAVKAGDTFTIRYYWRCPPTLQKNNLVAFVHFLHGAKRPVFQCDHKLLDGFEIDFQPEPETFVEEFEVQVPAHATAGVYEIGVGVYDATRQMARRLKIREPTGEADRRVEIKGCLTVLRK